MNEQRMAELVRQMLVEIGEDPEREGLKPDEQVVADALMKALDQITAQGIARLLQEIEGEHPSDPRSGYPFGPSHAMSEAELELLVNGEPRGVPPDCTVRGLT